MIPASEVFEIHLRSSIRRVLSNSRLADDPQNGERGDASLPNLRQEALTHVANQDAHLGSGLVGSIVEGVVDQNGVMRAAYANQAINLIVAVLMVPLLLRFLDRKDFVLWAIFTTFGGLTLQLESAIQVVSVREIARELHVGTIDSLRAAIRKTKRAYSTLSAFVLLPFLLFGLIYLRLSSSHKTVEHAGVEWAIFAAAYGLNYYFGTNNSIMLGLANVAQYNNINSFTRVLNIALTCVLLNAGLSLMGICISFAVSVVIGCVLMSHAARKCRERYLTSPQLSQRSHGCQDRSDSSNIVKYTLYTCAAYVLYKGGLLTANTLFSRALVSSYSLTLQAYTMLSAIALVPIQVWLSRMTKAVAQRDRSAQMHELALTIVTVNSIFVAGMLVLLTLGDQLLGLIHSKVHLGSVSDSLLVGLAFAVELNIFVLVNFLVTSNRFDFVTTYVSISLAAVVAGSVLALRSTSAVVALIALPMCLQFGLCLPLILRLACVQLGTTPTAFITSIARSLPGRH